MLQRHWYMSAAAPLNSFKLIPSFIMKLFIYEKMFVNVTKLFFEALRQKSLYNLSMASFSSLYSEKYVWHSNYLIINFRSLLTSLIDKTDPINNTALFKAARF